MVTFLAIVGCISLWLFPFWLLLSLASKVHQESELGSNTISTVAFVWFLGYLVFMVVFVIGSV